MSGASGGASCKPKMGDGGKVFRIRTGDGTIRIER